MDPNKDLIKQDINNGPYAILFKNSQGLEVEEIKEIFEEFGNVYSVKITGDKTGYRFVRYKSFEAVQKAVDGLKNHPTIKLLTHRKKNNNNQGYNNTNSDNQGSINGKINNNGRYFKNTNNGYNKENNNYENNYENTIEKNGMEKSLQKAVKNNSNQSIPLLVNGTETFLQKTIKSNGNQSIPLLIDETEKAAQEVVKRDSNDSIPVLVNGMEKSLQKTIKNNSNENIPLLLNTNNILNTDKIPDLVSPGRSVLSKKNIPKIKVFDAQEVIVGNIHPNISAAYILHLFERFEPIAITKILNVPKSEIRYCHVYFKKVEEALSVENDFDQMDLLGKKLVVLRTTQLLEEATS